MKSYRLLIAGSRNSSDNMRIYAQCCVQTAKDNNWQIIVGDNPEGVDKAVVDECNRLLYTNVIVVGSKRNKTPRNGGVNGGEYIQSGANYTQRDKKMVDAIVEGRCVYIWDGKSPGTHKGAIYARKKRKSFILWNFESTFTQ